MQLCEAAEALARARPEQLEAKRFFDLKYSEFAEAETNYERATGNVFEEAEALEEDDFRRR